MKTLVLLLAAPLAAQTARTPVRVGQHMILIEPSGTDLSVRETLVVMGGGKVALAVPPDAGIPQVQGATLRRGSRPGAFELDVPSAEETRVDLQWSMPFTVPEKLTGRILHGGPVRLVVPKDVKVSGVMLESNGVEPTTLASIFALKSPNYVIEIDGAGQLRTRQPAGAPEDGPTIDQIQPRIHGRMYWILGLTLGILAIGFALNYRAGRDLAEELNGQG